MTAALGAATVASSGSYIGTGTVTANAGDTLLWARSTTTPTGPFTAQPVDTLVLNDTSETSGAISGTSSAIARPTFDAGASMYYGRLRVGNAFGIELLPLIIPVETQYYTGIVWVTNSNDSCTIVPANAFAAGNWQRNLSGCLTSTTSGGAPTGGRFIVTLSAPGSGNSGSVDLTLNVGTVASGNACIGGASTAASALGMPWLQGNSGGISTYTTNPTGRAAFGLFSAPPGF